VNEAEGSFKADEAAVRRSPAAKFVDVAFGRQARLLRQY
jgi:hypothetical protein